MPRVYEKGDRVVLCPKGEVEDWMPHKRGDQGTVHSKDYGAHNPREENYLAICFDREAEKKMLFPYQRVELKDAAECDECIYRLTRLIEGCPDKI